MPFTSKRQQRAAFGGHIPGISKEKAREWAHETPNLKELPDRAPAEKGKPTLLSKESQLAHAHESAKGIAPSQLRAGEKVELEHTKSRAAAKQIAIDHLHERPDYYGLLEELEKKPLTSKKANFKLDGEQKFRGLDIAIENAKGSTRKWHDPHGKETGSTFMHFAYGYIRLTKGTDGDHVDVYIGPDEDAEEVFIVDQMKKPDFKTFDEQKVMLGFKDAAAAKAAYLKQYNDPGFFGSMKTMPFEEFKMKVLSRKNFGEKIASMGKQALTLREMGILHALGVGTGAAAGAYADKENRVGGALRGAVGGAVGPLGLLGAEGLASGTVASSAFAPVTGALAGYAAGHMGRTKKQAPAMPPAHELPWIHKYHWGGSSEDFLKAHSEGLATLQKFKEHLTPDGEKALAHHMEDVTTRAAANAKTDAEEPDHNWHHPTAGFYDRMHEGFFHPQVREDVIKDYETRMGWRKTAAVKIAFAVTPGMLSGLQHAGVGAGIGALAGGVGGAMHANPEHRGQGIMRGALMGAGLGAAGGAGISAIKGHGAQQLATLRGSAQEAEQAALGAHQNVKNIAQHGWGSEISHAAPPPSHVSTSAPTALAPSAAVEKGTLAARPGVRPPAENSTVAARLRPQPGAGAASPLNTQAQAVMDPRAHGYTPTQTPHGPGIVQGQEGAYRKLQGNQTHVPSGQTPAPTGTIAPAGGGAPSPGFSDNYDLARQQASAAGSRAAGLGLAANTLEAQQGVMNKAINRAGLVGAAAGTGLMGYMAVPNEYGGVSRQQPGAKIGEDATADRLDDLGIGILASPYIADIAAAGGKKLMLRGGRMGALGAELHGAAEGIGHYLHNPAVELGGLALVAPGVTHTLARGINKLRGVPPQEPPSAAPPTPATLAAEKVGRLLAQPGGQEKVAINVGGIASRGLSAGANFMWKNRKPIAGIAAVGAVGAGLYGGKKVIDTAKDMATEHHEPARYVGVPPGMRSPTSV